MSSGLRDRSDEVANGAFWEGAANGVMTMIPVGGMLAYARAYVPSFWTKTNWQSRTAIFLMPPLFVFGLTSEMYVNQAVREARAEATHAMETVRWAEDQLQQKQPSSTLRQEQEQRQEEWKTQREQEKQQQLELTRLYQYSIEQGNGKETIVPGGLQWYHHVANFAIANPVKVLAAVAVPSIAYIFLGNNQKEYLSFSNRLLQTRVVGQFATVVVMLSVVAFQSAMQQNGRYVTQEEVDARVQEMHDIRAALKSRLEAAKQSQLEYQHELEEAKEQDRLERKLHKKQKKHVIEAEPAVVATTVKAE